MKLTFLQTSDNKISKSQQRAYLSMEQARLGSTPLFVTPSRLVSDSSELAACRDERFRDSEVNRTSHVSFDPDLRDEARQVRLTARHVCEIKKYISNQIKEELHAKTLTNLGTEEKEFRCPLRPVCRQGRLAERSEARRVCVKTKFD